LALLGLRNYVFGFRCFFVSASAAAGTIFGGLVGLLFCCLAFAFLRKIVELVPQTF
jgi:hypothetical protein